MSHVFTRFLATAAGVLALGACATIIHGGKQDVAISSSPTSATVTIDNQSRGSTPMVASLTRKERHLVRIELPGYQPFETTLTRGVSGWVWGNIVFGGLIGLAVDAIGGGMYKLTPQQLSAQLTSGSAQVVPTDNGLYMVVVLKPEAGWQRIGQLERG